VKTHGSPQDVQCWISIPAVPLLTQWSYMLYQAQCVTVVGTHSCIGFHDGRPARQGKDGPHVCQRLSNKRPGIDVGVRRAYRQTSRVLGDHVADGKDHGRERQEDQREGPALGEGCRGEASPSALAYSRTPGCTGTSTILHATACAWLLEQE